MNDICKREDGVYIETFVIQNGERHNIKITSMKDAAIIFTDSLMDGFEKLVKE
jgi:hypothetical protein